MTRKQTFCMCGICGKDIYKKDESFTDIKLSESVKGMDETWQRYHFKCWENQ